MTGAARFLAAARRQPVDRTPVWFMRQAGRCLAAYRELREQYDILTITRTPELCARVTLMPVEEFGVDAAVLYADIMLPLFGMGVPFSIDPGIGPIIHEPVRDVAAVRALRIVDPHEATPDLFEAIRLIRSELDGRTAVLGFAGAPFTVASYLIEGRPTKDFARSKALMYGQPLVWHELMETLTEVTIRYLRAQVAAGVQAVQLFDSWVGTATLLEAMRDAGGTVIGVDWCTPLDQAWARIGYDHAVQGNMDPCALLSTRAVAEKHAQRALDAAGGRNGHIFNLGHGITPETPVDNVRAVVDYVHEKSAR
jgi:uroporphyrinogen decarboxylase